MTNTYTDTRGNVTQGIPFTHAVIKGLADGGGLFVPDHLPSLTLEEICDLATMPYWQRAASIYKKFEVDLPDETIDHLMQQAYGENFDSKDICPITSFEDGTHVLELWHGPTSAFKDMALQCLPLFFSASADQMRRAGEIDNTFLILVATSGDTGKAALEGFADTEGVRIAVLYPDGGVSDIQYKQMATQSGDNVMVWGVHGNFDDCQTSVKRTFDDPGFAKELMETQKVALSSANSINWGRLLPQIVYYVSGYASLVANDQIHAGDPIDVCVPTGNFGNILAAWYAKQMGTPIDHLLCASNENRILTDFIQTGIYDISDRPFILTPSPSMDILVSSNLERQLFELTGRDTEAIASWMNDLANDRKFEIDDETFAKLRKDFMSDSVSSADCLSTIKRVYEERGYLLDPHTAVAWEVAQRLRGENPILIASTAHWAKFGANVYRALHGISPDGSLPADIEALSGCQLNHRIEQETSGTYIPQGLARLDDMPIRFTDVIDPGKTSIEAATLGFIAKQ